MVFFFFPGRGGKRSPGRVWGVGEWEKGKERRNPAEENERETKGENQQLTNFHSTMTPDGEVYIITGLENQALIEAQALKLNDRT